MIYTYSGPSASRVLLAKSWRLVLTSSTDNKTTWLFLWPMGRCTFLSADEMVTQRFDERRADDINYLDFAKAFDYPALNRIRSEQQESNNR